MFEDAGKQCVLVFADIPHKQVKPARSERCLPVASSVGVSIPTILNKFYYNKREFGERK
jgi:hypothetical protein